LETEERLKFLRLVLSSLAPIPEGQWPLLLQRCSPLSVKAKANVLSQGEPADKIHFVCKGVLKTCYTHGADEPITKGFVWEGRLAAPYTAILTRQISNIGIVALEDSDLVEIPASVLPELFASHCCWQELGRKFAELLLVERERREFQMMTLDAQARYEAFQASFPELVNRIPQYEVASYLGITPVTLSRIRARRAGKGQPS